MPSKEPILIQNAGDVAVPVGGAYLMPGEQRRVIPGHYEVARAAHPDALIQVDDEAPKESPETTEPDETPAPEPGESLTPDPGPLSPNPEPSPPAEGPRGRLTNLTFVIAGNLPGWTQSDAEAFITAHGGRVVDTLGMGVDALVAGDNPGRKLNQAKKASIPVVDKDALLEMAGAESGEEG